MLVSLEPAVNAADILEFAIGIASVASLQPQGLLSVLQQQPPQQLPQLPAQGMRLGQQGVAVACT